MLAEPVLVGRERELEELMRYLDSVIEGKGSTVFISGEAGSGKTRLTREFLKAANEKGVGVMAGWCLSEAAVPYFPFVEAFNANFASFPQEEHPTNIQQPGTLLDIRGVTQITSTEREITKLLTGPSSAEKPGKPQALSPQVWKDQTFAAVTRTLHSISTQAPIILFLEDIHWADSASLALLHYIARSITSERILVLATFRSEALTADAEGHPHPLAEALRSMGREDLFTEIKLPNLNQTEVSKIAENMIGGNLQPYLAEKLADESRGNPLFIVESLRMLLERKNLIQENNEWRLTVAELAIPTKIKDIILRRLAILKRPQTRVLEAASVIGEKFDLELLSAVLNQDSLEILETLTVIAQTTSIVRVEGDCYRFDHAKSREALYEELPLPLKKGYHARTAEKLENASKSGKLPYSELAYHYAEAGNKEKAVKYSLAEGQEALAKYSNPEARKHFSYVLQNISETAENVEARRTAQEGLGDAYYANGMLVEAAKIFEALAHSETGQVSLRAYRKAMDSAFVNLAYAHGVELAKEAEKYAGFDRLEGARILLFRAKVECFSGDLKSSLKTSEEALRVYEEEYALEDAARILFHVSYVYVFTKGLQEKGIGAILRSVALFQELEDFPGQMEAIIMKLANLVRCGLFEEATSTSLNLLRILEKRAPPLNLWISLDLESRELFVEAVAQNLKVINLYREPGPDMWVCSALTRQYARLGDLGHAEEYYTKLVNFPATGEGVIISKAVFFAAKDQWMEANHGFEKAFEELSRIGQPSGWDVLLRKHYAWALKRQERFDEAKVQLEEAQRVSRDVEERFGHVSLQASVMVRRAVRVGEEFEMRLDLVNVSRKSGVLLSVKSLVHPELAVTSLPANYRLENGSLETKNRSIGPFQVETLKLKIKASKPGTFTLNPQVSYIDELGETKVCKSNPIIITVQHEHPKYEVLPGRVPTGLEELDALLFGGIPQNYAVALTSPSTDERELLVKRFLEAGASAGETIFYLTAEAASTEALAEKYPSNFFLFVCNPQADAMIQSLPNVYKLKGVENLTDIDIALTKAFRTLKPSAKEAKRICLEIVSDVLLQHHAINTRRWLSALLPTLKSKCFTILAVVDPSMHPSEELQANLSVFDGEIRVSEKETPEGIKQALKIKKLINQKYSDKEIILNKEALSD